MSHLLANGEWQPERSWRTDTVSEIELIRHARRGDERAFELLVVRDADRVFRVALGILRSEDDARDVMQEVLIKVFKSLHSFQFRSSFSTWITRITITTALDELARRAHEPLSLDDISNWWIVGQEFDDDEVIGRLDEGVALEQALSRLASDERFVLILRHVYGFTYKQIARTLDLPVGTVKSHDHRGRARLREMLRKLHETTGGNQSGVGAIRDAAATGPSSTVGAQCGRFW